APQTGDGRMDQTKITGTGVGSPPVAPSLRVRAGRQGPANRRTTMDDSNPCANAPTATDGELDLVLERLIDAPREKLFRCWTEPELMKQWFAPKPWETPRVEVDVRPGGSSMVVMRGPDGTECTSHGVYLEVVENERLVFTDAFIDAWTPSKKPFM